jgi:cystathionine beta-lyase/cystathionine gamma-synthase
MVKPAGLFSVRINVNLKSKLELFVNSLRQFIIGVSWGGHESLVFPVMSFDEERTNKGYSNNLVRFYIGLDDADTLIRDLEQAFEKLS